MVVEILIFQERQRLELSYPHLRLFYLNSMNEDARINLIQENLLTESGVEIMKIDSTNK